MDSFQSCNVYNLVDLYTILTCRQSYRVPVIGLFVITHEYKYMNKRLKIVYVQKDLNWCPNGGDTSLLAAVESTALLHDESDYWHSS